MKGMTRVNYHVYYPSGLKASLMLVVDDKALDNNLYLCNKEVFHGDLTGFRKVSITVADLLILDILDNPDVGIVICNSDEFEHVQVILRYNNSFQYKGRV